eukprot:m.270651 g.270651  ORF g.270651 m.270651 type:complete len:79 (-) comp39774_c0_seq1:306-542(-)
MSCAFAKVQIEAFQERYAKHPSANLHRLVRLVKTWRKLAVQWAPDATPHKLALELLVLDAADNVPAHADALDGVLQGF